MFKFHWLTRFALAVGLIGALVAAPAVGGSRLLNKAEAMSVQSVTGTWVSSVTVLNPSNSPGPADVTLTFYDPNGVQIVGATQTSLGLAPGNTAFWYVPNIAGLTTNQTYSAVVSASQQVYATVNLATAAGTTPQMGETYNGVDTTVVATSASAPAVYQNYYGFTSNVVVQNTDATSATVTVTLSGSNGSGPVSFTTPTQTIAANAAFTFDLANFTSQLGAGFKGAATVNGGSNHVAVISNNYTPTAVTTAPGVTGFLFSSANATTPASGSTKAFIPALYNYYYGYFTSLTVENVDTTPANVTVTYSNGATDSASGIAPNTSHLFFTPSNHSLPPGWQGSATVTSTGGQKIVAVVNEQGTPGTTASGGLASYNGFGAGFLNVFAPGLVKAYYGFNSSLTVQNVDTVTAAAGSISVTYGNTTPAVVRTNPTALGPGASWLVYQPSDSGLKNGYNGGATVKSTTAKIVGVVNISGTPFSDQLFGTNGFGQ